MANVIEQIVQPKNFGSQTIEMTVRSNERGPQGEKGDSGNAATVSAGNAYALEYGQQPQVINSGTSSEAVLDFYIPKGQPGAIHYYAGPGINITDDNRIEATGEMAVYWGDLVGAISNQTDLMNILNGKQNNLTAGANITIAEGIISATDTTYTAGNNVQITDNVISATDTTYTNFVGSTGVASGQAGLVPAPSASANNAVLKGDGSWGTVNSNNIANNAVTAGKIASNAVTADKINSSSITTSKIASNAVTADKIDYSTIPQPVTVMSDNYTSSSTTRVLIGQVNVTGLNPNWNYLVLMNYGLLSGPSNSVVASDITVANTTDELIPPNRIRGGGIQQSPSWHTIYQPKNSAITLNINGSTDVAGNFSIESVRISFIPLRPAS